MKKCYPWLIHENLVLCVRIWRTTVGLLFRAGIGSLRRT